MDTKGKRPRHRLLPMNGPVRAALQKLIDSSTTGSVFDYKQTGVSARFDAVLRKRVSEQESVLVSRSTAA